MLLEENSNDNSCEVSLLHHLIMFNLLYREQEKQGIWMKLSIDSKQVTFETQVKITY